eukprot:m.45969 g.45969  ORF g.45969 m.45969 type:complete len:1054 (+) comp33652_c0_seq2:162-3323(+)
MNSAPAAKRVAVRMDRGLTRPINRNRRMKVEKVHRRLTLNGGSSTYDVTAVEGTDPDGNVTRCLCGYVHDDGYMICCDRCAVWQHIECVGISPSHVPDSYLCDFCDPRPLDHERAMLLQRQKLENMGSSDSDTENDTAGSSPPDFSNALCEGVVHDHLSSTLLSTTFTGPGQPRKRTRKPSLSKGVEMPKLPDAVSLEMKPPGLDNVADNVADVLLVKQPPVSIEMPHIMQAPPREIREIREMPFHDTSENYEPLSANRYSSAVTSHVEQYLQAVNPHRSLQPQSMHDLCSVRMAAPSRKGLFINQDVDQNSFLVEYIGHFVATLELGVGQNPWEVGPFPFVFFFEFSRRAMCVDARKQGNIARFVKRSCKPNARVSHFFVNSELHLGIYSRLPLKKDSEITIDFDFQYTNCRYPIECPCQSMDCLIVEANMAAKARLAAEAAERPVNSVRGLHLPREEDNQGELMEHHEEQQQAAGITRKLGSSWSNCIRPGQRRRRRKLTDGNSANTPTTKKEGDVDSDGESNHMNDGEPEKKKNLSREERKMEAIMKAFERMEKSQKRKRSEALPVKIGGPPSPDPDDRRGDKSYRGRRASMLGKRKQGRRKFRGLSGAGATSDCLSPDSNSNLTATPPLTPQIDILSPTVSPFMTPVPSSSKLPRKKHLLHEWRENQEKMQSMPTTFAGILSSRIQVAKVETTAATAAEAVKKENPDLSSLENIGQRDPESSQPLLPSIKTEENSPPPPPPLPLSPTKPKPNPVLCTKKRWLRMAQNTKPPSTSNLNDAGSGDEACRPPSPAGPPPPPQPSATEVREVNCLLEEVKEGAGKAGKKKVSLLEYRNRKKDSLARSPAAKIDPVFGSSGSVYSAFGMTYEEPKFVTTMNFDETETKMSSFLGTAASLTFPAEQQVQRERDETPLIEPVTPDDGSKASGNDPLSPREADVVRWTESGREEELPPSDKMQRVAHWAGGGCPDGNMPTNSYDGQPRVTWKLAPPPPPPLTQLPALVTTAAKPASSAFLPSLYNEWKEGTEGVQTSYPPPSSGPNSFSATRSFCNQ